jgi:hypothetical protein
MSIIFKDMVNILRLIFALFAVWQLAVIIYQFSDSFRKWLDPLAFYCCGLLPSWRMFGPAPVDGDYCLFYRTATEEGSPFSDWQRVDDPKKTPAPLTLFFNPGNDLSKALRDICQQAIRSDDERNVNCQMLLNHLTGILRQHGEAAPAAGLLQFQIRWRTPSVLQPIFSSHVYRL